MLREEFIEDIADWEDLLSFCEEHFIDTCCNIYCQYDAYNQIISRIDNAINYDNYTWEDIRDDLNDISSGCEYYLDEGGLCFTDISDDFEQWKGDVLDLCDNEGIWDGECEEDETDNESFLPTEEPESELTQADTDSFNEMMRTVGVLAESLGDEIGRAAETKEEFEAAYKKAEELQKQKEMREEQENERALKNLFSLAL